MSINVQYKSIIKAISEYENLLSSLSEDEFMQSPPNGGWSFSETYSHIFQTNLGSLIAAEKCILRTGVHSRQSHSLAGRDDFVLRKVPSRKD